MDNQKIKKIIREDQPNTVKIGMTNNKLNIWYKQRDMPKPPKESFRDWYTKNGKSQIK